MIEQGIRSMFDLRDNNTWVFLGGSSVSGNAQDIGGARGYVALFEEYIRWTVAWECEGDAARQRYVINAGYSGCNLKKVLDTFEKRVSVLDPAAVSYMAGIEDMQSEDSIKNFSKQLKELLEKILALRNNTAQAVIQTPYSTNGTENFICADLTAQIIAVKASLPKEKSERVTVVNHFDCTNNPAFHAIYLNSNGSLNPRGNLEIARQLALATVGDANGHPFECTYSMQPKATPWNIFSQELSQIKALSTAQKRIFALLNDKEHSASWLIVGDSIPHGIQRIGAYDGIAQHLEKYLKCDCERYEDLVINTAVSGATTAMTLGALSSRVIKYKADVALLMLGTNDAHTNKTPKEGGTGKGHTPEQFKINMRLLLDALIKKNPDVLILLSTPVPTTDILRTDVPKLAGVIRELSKEAAYKDSTILIDQYAYFDALFSKQPEVFKILPDGLHPDARGHLILIQGLLFACGLFDKESRLFKLSYELPCAIPAH